MDNPFSLKHKNILITGASSGIGRQCAISCSQMGANIILVDIDGEGLKKTLYLMKHNKHVQIEQDITDYYNIESHINNCVLQIGKIDGFIHSAGVEATFPLNTLKSGKFEKVYSVNVISAFNLARIISKRKYIGDKASFVFISSIMAEYGQPGKIAYCSSKGALSAGAKAMALELASKNIRVNSILPAMVKSEMSIALLESLSLEARQDIEAMHPFGIGDVTDVANACVFLLSDASRWITGTNLIVDGGYSAR